MISSRVRRTGRDDGPHEPGPADNAYLFGAFGAYFAFTASLVYGALLRTGRPDLSRPVPSGGAAA